MRRWIYVNLLLLLPLLLLSQEGTTLEEFRYLTKGYAYQLEMGLDAHKEGYEVRKLYTTASGTQFVGLYRYGQPQLRGLLAVVDAQTPKAKYICIPNQYSSEAIKAQCKQHKQSHLIGSTARQQFEASLTALLLRSLDEPMLAAPRRAPQPQQPVVSTQPPEIELTSRGIPINTENYRLPAQEAPRPNATAILPANLPTEMDQPSAGLPAVPAVESRAEVSVGGLLSNRGLVEAPQIDRKYAGRGQVVVKICVDARGEVISAKFTQRGSTTFNESLKAMAIESARKALFAVSSEIEQCGTIAYKFK
ncbi:MAG: hypothetical protein AAGG75_24745 [Bacteroidota bacterium]